MGKFKVGDKVVASNGARWINGDPYRIVQSVNYTDGEYRYTLNIEYSNCKWFERELELYKEENKEKEREIDWNKIPKYTPVQVRSENDEEWKNKYFIRHNRNDNNYKFIATIRSGFVEETESEGEKAIGLGYKQCRIHESVEIQEEWYKTDFYTELAIEIDAQYSRYCNSTTCPSCKYDGCGIECKMAYTVQNIDRIKKELSNE